MGRRGPTASWCSPEPASRPTRASPTSAGPMVCGRRTPKRKSWPPSSTTSAIPRSGGGRGGPGSSRPPGPPGPTPATRHSSSSSDAGKLLGHRHPERRRPAPAGRQLTRARHRGARHDVPCRSCWSCGDERPMDEILDRVRAGEDGPAVRAVRRHREVGHHLLRPAARARGDRPGLARRRPRPTSCSRSARACRSIRPPASCRRRSQRRRPVGDRQRRADALRRHRRRRAARLDQRDPPPACGGVS